MTFHLAAENTAHHLASIAPGVFDNDVQPELLRAFLANHMNHLVVAVADDTVIGMASAISYVHPGKPLQLFINEVGVADDYRRRGIGRRLMQRLQK